jgi:hypothetical protein
MTLICVRTKTTPRPQDVTDLARLADKLGLTRQDF